MLFQARTVGCHVAENEAAIAGDARNFGEPMIFALERRAVARRHRHAQQAAVIGIGPGVIGAAEETAVADLVLTHGGAAMAAAVHERGHAAVREPRNDDGMTTDVGGLVVALLGDLAIVPEIDPGAIEDPLHLERKDLGVGVDRAMHGIPPDQAGDILLRHRTHPGVLILTFLAGVGRSCARGRPRPAHPRAAARDR